ncbi:glycosyltransferase family 4 protein [Roseobacter sp. A03A-229]
MTRAATFAIPGDIDTLTGGYIYEKQLLLALRRVGWDVTHLALPGGFPHPTARVVHEIVTRLAALPADRPVILDGFLSGALPPDQLAQMQAPFVAVTHHPLAYETGLAPERAADLMRSEQANLARTAHVIVPSPHTAEILTQDFGVPDSRITVAPPGVLRPAPSPAPRTEVPEILAVGQLVPRKGHDTLLRALAHLTDLPWTASIVGRAGDPAYGAELRALADSLGLKDRVRFTGSLSPHDLAAQYASASIFALATHYEGYGMVFAEAMVHGLPIVTCDGGAVPDTVPPDAGNLVPVGDSTAFATALRRLLTEDDMRRRMSAASARAGRSLPDWEDTARIVSAVLARIAPQP